MTKQKTLFTKAFSGLFVKKSQGNELVYSQGGRTTTNNFSCGINFVSRSQEMDRIDYGKIYQQCPPVKHGITLLKNSIASIELQIQESSTGEFIEETKNNPIIEVLNIFDKCVNQNSSQQAIEQIFLNYFLYGNVYLKVLYSEKSGFSQMEIIDPRDVVIDTGNINTINGVPRKYTVSYCDTRSQEDYIHVDIGGSAFYKLVGSARRNEEENDSNHYLLHYREAGTKRGPDRFYGDSPLEAVKTSALMICNGLATLGDIYSKGYVAGYYNMSYPPMEKGADMAGVQQFVVKNTDAIRTAVSEAQTKKTEAIVVGADYSSIGYTPKDMNYKEISDLNEKAIYKALGIPLEIATSENTTYTNKPEAFYQYWVQAVLPAFEQFVNAILNGKMLKLIGEYNGDYRVWYNRTDIPAIKERSILQTISQAPFLTTNEVRTELGVEVIANELYDEVLSVVALDKQPDAATTREQKAADIENMISKIQDQVNNG